MNNCINVATIDSLVWDPEQVALELILKLNIYRSVKINLMREAPDIVSTKLDKIIDTVLSYGFVADQIEIHTGNIVESYNKVNIIKHPEWMFELSNFKKIAPLLDKQKQIIQHFGCLIGRSNQQRLIMASHMWAHYKDKTFLTYHYCSQTDYHREHIGLEEIMYYFGTSSPEYTEALNLLQFSPILQDTIKTYPILMPENVTIPCSWYKNFFVDLVCETFTTGNTFFVTEKFWRAVSTKTPFIIQGPQHILRRLKQLGFKTFDRWWDEGYDEDPYPAGQDEIKKVLAKLSAISLVDINNMYQDMQLVLDHNYNHMMNLDYKDFELVQ